MIEFMTKQEPNPSWQVIVDAAINATEYKIAMKSHLNALIAEEDATAKKLCLSGNGSDIRVLRKLLWKDFYSAFQKFLPDYKLDLKEVASEAERERIKEAMEAQEKLRLETKKSPRLVSIINPAETPLWDDISDDFKEYYCENAYKAWFSDAEITQKFNEKAIIIKVSSAFRQRYIEENFLHKLKELMANYTNEYQIKVEVK